jgi:Spy/CpxP family protein refolding chaperone/thiol-disulfide isomerase/thioredoxin
LTTILLLLFLCGLCVPRTLADDTTQPYQAALSPQQSGDPMFMVRSLRLKIETLNLDGQKRTRVESILNAAADRAEELKLRIRDLPPDEKTQRVALFIREVRRRLAALLPDVFSADTQPSSDNGAIGQFFPRFANALRQLDLTPDQRLKLADLAATIREQAAAIRQRRQAGQDVSADLRSMQADFRGRLTNILTADQQAKLRDLLRQPAAPQPTGPAPPPLNSPPDAHNPFIGPPAPSIRLTQTDLNVVDLSKFKNRVVVLEFGSVTCPSFRDHVQEMEKLYKHYGERVSFFVIYTREAHPSDGWNVSRNEDDRIDVHQPTDIETRMDIAEKAKTYLHISIPLLVDDLEDTAAKAYNGAPNATVILAGGNIVARQQWTDPSGLPRLIDDALGDK